VSARAEAAAGEPSAAVRVGEWTVSRERNELASGPRVVRLEPKVVEVLLHLAARPAAVVSREELLTAVWPGVIVGDDALTQAIIKLRKAFGDDAHEPRYIETIPKRGYRLIAPVAPADVEAPPARKAARPRRTRMLAAAAAVTVAAVLALAWLAQRGGTWPLRPDTRGATGSAIPIVAVLPLANLSGDPRRDYFSDGVTEDIINALGRFANLRVMSRNAVEPYRGKAPSPKEVREQLGARYLVQGSLREADGTVRVAVQLTDATQGTVLWSDQHDGRAAQVFEIQDRIVRRVVASLQVRVTQLEEERALSAPVESLEAYDLVLRARALIRKRDRAANREARTLLARARTLAPDYAEAMLAGAEAEVQRALYGWVEDAVDTLSRGMTLANQALASPDARSHARAHALISGIESNRGNAPEALAAAERAVALNRNDPSALYRLGSELVYVGRLAEGIDTLELAHRLDPDPGAGISINILAAYHVAGRYRDELTLANQLLVRFPTDVGLLASRTGALAELGRVEEAREAARTLRRVNPYFEVKYYGNRFVRDEDRERMKASLRKAGLEP
jgi:adenylate cyclase